MVEEGRREPTGVAGGVAVLALLQVPLNDRREVGIAEHLQHETVEERREQ